MTTQMPVGFSWQTYSKILDVGCGTGALCQVLSEKGLQVTGVEPSDGMLKVAQKKLMEKGVRLDQGDALEGLCYEDQAFDLVITSYVAHGMKAPERSRLYLEMARMTTSSILLFDYSEKRSRLTDIVEFLEGGDYFHFIQVAKEELESHFSQVLVQEAGPRSAWYWCMKESV